MAYLFVPRCVEDIRQSNLNFKPCIERVFTTLTETFNKEAPISIDLESKKKVKIKIIKDIEIDVNGDKNAIFELLHPEDKSKLSIRWGNGAGRSTRSNAITTTKQEKGSLLFIKSLVEFNQFPTLEELSRIYPEYNEEWLATFKKQAELVNTFLNGDCGFEYSHDSGFMKVLISKIKSFWGWKKDSWNPSDIFLIKKSTEERTIKEFESICDSVLLDKEEKLIAINEFMKEKFISKELIGISLKKMKIPKTKGIYTDGGQLEISNLNKRQTIIEPKLKKFSINFDLNDCIWKWTNISSTFTFQIEDDFIDGFLKANNTPGTRVVPALLELKIKNANAKMGRVPSMVEDRIFSRYNLNRYIASTLPKIGELNGVEEWIRRFEFVQDTLTQYMDFGNLSSAKDFERLLFKIAESEIKHPNLGVILRVKLCALQYAYLFAIAHKKNELAQLLSDLYYGAKRELEHNSVFIKIY